MAQIRSWWYWPSDGTPGRRILVPVLWLAAIVVLIGTVVIWQDYREHRKSTIEAAGGDAARVAFEIEQLIEGRLNILGAIAAAPAFRKSDITLAREYLTGVDAAALGFDGLIFYVDTATALRARSRFWRAQASSSFGTSMQATAPGATPSRPNRARGTQAAAGYSCSRCSPTPVAASGR